VLRLGWVSLLAGTLATSVTAQTETVLPEGPWGRVEVVPIEIRLPESMVPDIPLPLQPWVLEMDRERAARLLAEVGIGPELAVDLLSTYEWDAGGELHPTAAMIRGIDASARARLYEVLRSIPGNASQQSPHRFKRARLEERFRRLSPAPFAILRPFLYERATLPESLLLADLPAVMALIDDPRERVRVIQAVSKQESLLLRLNLDDTSDAAALAEYWGRGRRRRDLEILLDSLIDDERSRRIDLIYLLPAFVRSFVLTYPRLENARSRDCYWTALNFFRPAPDDRLTGGAVGRTMVDDYTRVDGALQLGDMLVLFRPTGEAEHAAVYIAGDVYFTKNGNNIAMPWLFMRLNDILERYDDAEHTPLTHYRLKNLD